MSRARDVLPKVLTGQLRQTDAARIAGVSKQRMNQLVHPETLTVDEVAKRLSPLDLDGMAIMASPPEQFPAYLVIRLCEPKPLTISHNRGAPRRRPPLAEKLGRSFRLTDFGRQVAASIATGNRE